MTDAPRDTLARHLAGRYLVERELGRGGMGIVYLARDVALDRPVAIKLLPPELARSATFRARFLQEARTAARLAHPNIVPIHAVEHAGELGWIVMGYIAGDTLAERVRRDGPLPPAEAMRMVQEAAWALAYAHQHGVVHRDVKPENILLERGTGRALLTDFGIAQVETAAGATPQGTLLGTARTASPEQAAGEPVDGRSDLYSLGVTAFFALTGRYPFEGETSALLAQHLTALPAPLASLRPGLPRSLAAAVDRCLAKSPDGRFENGEELAAALAAGEAGAPVPRTLQQLTREISGLGVDLAGYGTLALVATLTQLLTRDFLGFGYAYTVGLACVVASLAILRGVQVGRLTREARREGWEATDLSSAAERLAREQDAGAAPPLGRRLGLYAAGLAAVLLIWLGPKQWGQAQLELPAGLLVELLSLVLPVALGRWLGAALEAPRESRPGLISRFFLRVKSGIFFRLLGAGLGKSPRSAPVADQPTELLLADQARQFLQALPPAERERLGGAEQLVQRLERDAVQLRQRLRELDDAGAELGGRGSAERQAVGAELDAARRAAAERLSTAVSALETVRLELLRARAGLQASDSLTGDLALLQRLGDLADDAGSKGGG